MYKMGDSVLEIWVIFMLSSILQSKQIWNEGLFHAHYKILQLKQYIHWSSWGKCHLAMKQTQKRCMTWRVSLRPIGHMTVFSSIPQKRTKSLQLTIALYCLPIVFSITTKHYFIPFFWHGHRLGKCCKMVYVVRDIPSRNRPKLLNENEVTVRAEIFAVVLFSRISRVKPSRKFPLQFMSIYSNDNISKIAKLTTRELLHLAKTAKITVRENNGVYSISILFFKFTLPRLRS